MTDMVQIERRLSKVEDTQAVHGQNFIAHDRRHAMTERSQRLHHDRITATENGIGEMRRETQRTCEILLRTDKTMTAMLSAQARETNAIKLKLAEFRGVGKAIIWFQVLIGLVVSITAIYQAISH